jgi:hypothetical protein
MLDSFSVRDIDITYLLGLLSVGTEVSFEVEFTFTKGILHVSNAHFVIRGNRVTLFSLGHVGFSNIQF